MPTNATNTDKTDNDNNDYLMTAMWKSEKLMDSFSWTKPRGCMPEWAR